METSYEDELGKEVAQVGVDLIPYVKEIDQHFQEFTKYRKETLEVLWKCINTIDWHCRNGTSTNIAASTAGIVGGVLSVGAIAAAPFTGGLSLLTLGVGGAIGGASTLTGLGSDLAVKKLVDDELGNAQSRIDLDYSVTQKLRIALQRYSDRVKEFINSLKTTDEMTPLAKVKLAGMVAWNAYQIGINTTNAYNAVFAISKYGILKIGFGRVAMTGEMAMQLSNVASITKWSTKLSMNLSTKSVVLASKVLIRLSAVLGVVSVISDSFSLINNIKSLSSGQLSETSIALRDAVNKLEEEEKDLYDIMDDLFGIYGDALENTPLDTPVVFRSKHSNKYINVDGGNRNDGTRIQIWEGGHIDGNNKFYIKQSETPGYYLIQNVLTDSYVNCEGGGTRCWTKIHQWNTTSQDSRWWFSKESDGFVSIRPFNDRRRCINVTGGGYDNGTQLILWDNPYYPHSQWKIEEERDIFPKDVGRDPLENPPLDTPVVFRSKHSDKYINVDGGNRDDGTPIQIWERGHNDDNCTFYIRKSETPGCYLIQNVHTGSYVNRAGGGIECATIIHQWNTTSVDSSWWFNKESDGFVSICPPISDNMCINVTGGGNNNGVRLVLWDNPFHPHSNWKIEER